MPDTTTPGTPSISPVTSQDVTPPATSGDNLESQHSADTFKALSELFDTTEGTPVVTPVTPPVQPHPVTAPDPAPQPTPVGTETPAPIADDFEKTLDGIKPAERAHPNVQKGMDELRRISREEHKRAEELILKQKEYETKLTDYENKLKSPTVPEDVQKELDDLRNMRKELDLRMDPDFNKNFVQPVKDAEINIMRILTEAGLKDETAKWIQDHGGVIAMSRSNSMVDDKLTAQQWVEDVLLAKTPTFHRNRALGELTNALNVQDRAQKELQDFQGSAKERWDSKMKKLTDDFNIGRDTALAELGDAIKPKVPSATSTPEEKLAIEAHNTRLKQAEVRYNELIKSAQDPKVAGAVLVKATQADVLAASNKELEARVVQLRETIDRIKASGSHSQAGDRTPPPAAAPATPQPGDLLKISDNTALGGLLNQAGVLR